MLLKNVRMLNSVGVRIGSQPKRMRRKYGVPREMKDGMVALSVVGRMRDGGMKYEGRRRRQGKILRGCSVAGVITNL